MHTLKDTLRCGSRRLVSWGDCGVAGSVREDGHGAVAAVDLVSALYPLSLRVCSCGHLDETSWWRKGECGIS